MMLANAGQFPNLFLEAITSEHQARVQCVTNIGDNFA
jgi:hypothetical protein